MREISAEEGAAVLPPVRRTDRVVLDHVSFAYREGAQILSDIGLALEWGRKYALVGPSGSGWPGAWRCGPAL